MGLPREFTQPFSNFHLMHKIFPILFVFSLIFGISAPVLAQGQVTAYATIYNVDSSAFPAVTSYVDVFDTTGIFASGLTSEAVSVIEDGQPLPAVSFIEMAIPLQLTVAVNQGSALDARNANGISRYQRVAQVVMQWAQARPADLPDDLSLVSQAGPVINHANAADFIVGLQGFQPDMRVATPNLQSLVTALDVVSAQTPRIGMKRAILFITPQMQDPNLAATLEPLIQRALENKIRIFVWYVDANTTFTTTSAAIFNNLAIQTGGSMFQFSGEERFPDPEAYFSPLRRIYLLSYISRIKGSGEHSLNLQVNLPSGVVNASEQKFTLDIQPPNPFPVAPVLQITRQAPEDDPFNTEILLPETQDIEIIVEFPDGFKRPLARTALSVDGVVVDENTTEPFDNFTWDLKTYTSSGVHQITVEAVDVLGMSKTSMPMPVTITVVKPPSGPTAFLAKYRIPLTFGAIIFAGLVLFAILLGGRLRFLSLRAIQEKRRVQNDPLTQPIQALAEQPVQEVKEKTKKRRKQSGKTETGQKSNVEAAASLVRINSEGQFVAVPPIPLNGKEVVIGTDPVQCTQIMDDASIAAVHARIRLTDDGGYLLQDGQPLPGTWVNFEPLPREGYRLIHGDMVNFGQLTYRFMLRNPQPNPSPKITFLASDE
ncbi:MAG TPA: FHA domain-containing protein [Anaerolineales bacterium]|nr:FHA domain-containing protein [Anaerolineales bacterium]